MLVQDPRNLSFSAWAATVVVDLGLAQLPTSEHRWKDWAQSVYQTTNVPPDPAPFTGWQEWGLAWIRST